MIKVFLKMNLLNKIVNKLFEKEEEQIINSSISFDDTCNVFTAFIRKDITKENLKFIFQEYLKSKEWYIRHTGPATMIAFQTHPNKRTIEGLFFQI